jgi:hypothetical protein
MRAHRFAPLLSAVATLTLAACGTSDSALGDQPTLTGQIEGWDRGAGFTLRASVLKTVSPLMTTVIASAPIDAAGNFSITLPGSAVVGPLLTTQHSDPSQLPPGCTGDLQVNPQDFAGTSALFDAVSGTTTLSVSLSNLGTAPAGGVQISAGFAYADREVSETGTLTCSFSGFTQQSTADAHLKAGWNREVLQLTMNAAAKMATSSVSTGPLPDGVKWRFK